MSSLAMENADISTIVRAVALPGRPAQRFHQHMAAATPSAEERESFRFGGTRARPRKGIEAIFRSGEVYLKPPGSCRSRWPALSIGIEVECCDGCEIYVLDTCEQVQIADCRNCRIVVAPCAGSVFLLDCTGCRVSVAAKQLRLRDVTDCELRTYAPTHESIVIETSSNVRFGCWDVAYPGLTAQMAALGWDPQKNCWRHVYDFSPAAAGSAPNWTLIPDEEQCKTRWAELVIAPEGLAGGTVTEVRGSEPSVEGCECECAASDGTLYRAAWYSGPKSAQPSGPTAGASEGEKAGSKTPTAASSSNSGEGGRPPASSFLQVVFDWVASFFGFGTKETKPILGTPKPMSPGEVTSHTTTCALQ